MGGEHVARERSLEILAVQTGESVLEIGFGTGHSLVQLAKAVGETGQVTGIDISKGMRDVAQKRIAEAGLGARVKLEVAAVPPLPFADKTFDVVTISFTLELFPIETIPSVLAECRRVLKPAGRLGVASMAAVKEGDRENASTYSPCPSVSWWPTESVVSFVYDRGRMVNANQSHGQFV